MKVFLLERGDPHFFMHLRNEVAQLKKSVRMRLLLRLGMILKAEFQNIKISMLGEGLISTPSPLASPINS